MNPECLTKRSGSKQWYVRGILCAVMVVLMGVPGDASAAEPNRIGIIAPLTGPGAGYGEVLSKASIMAIEEINAAGGITGRRIEYLVEDGQCIAKEAIRAYNKLVNVDKIKVILGPGCSSELLGIAPFLDRDEVLVFSSGANADEVTGASRFIFRNSAPNREAVRALAPFVFKRYRWVNMVTAFDDYMEGLRRGFTKEYRALGGEIRVDEHFKPDATEFRGVLTKVLQGNPPALVLNCLAEFDCGTIAKQVRELGYKGQLFSWDGFVTKRALEIAGTAADGAIAAVAPSISPENVKGQEALAKFKRKYGYTSWEFYLASAYDAPYILARCIAKVGNVSDTEKLRDCLYGVKQYHGAAGTYGFDQQGDPVGIVYFIAKVEGGKPSILKEK